MECMVICQTDLMVTIALWAVNGMTNIIWGWHLTHYIKWHKQ